jgi:hypothetical protein
MTLRSQMMRLWKITSGNADGDFRIYERSLAGADCVCKALTGANEYELNKYSLAEETTLSKSVFRVVRTLDEMADRRCGKLNRKNGQVQNVAGLKTPAQHGPRQQHGPRPKRRRKWSLRPLDSTYTRPPVKA